MPIEIRNSGLVVAYWRVTHVQVDHAAGTLECRLHGWPDRAARAAGKAPLPSLVWRLTAEAMGRDDLHAVTTADLYRAVRALPATDGVVWFADALPC